MLTKKRIEERQKIRRAEIAKSSISCNETTFLLISESLDDYIEHRIQTDKVLEGILKDIQGDIASMTDWDAMTERLKKFYKEYLNEIDPIDAGPVRKS